MDDSFVCLQSERSQLLARGLVSCVTDAANPETLRDLDEQWLVIDKDDLLGRHLGNVQRKPKYVGIGLPKVNKA